MQPRIVVTEDVLEQRRLAKQHSNAAPRIGKHNYCIYVTAFTHKLINSLIYLCIVPFVYNVSADPSGIAPQTSL